MKIVVSPFEIISRSDATATNYDGSSSLILNNITFFDNSLDYMATFTIDSLALDGWNAQLDLKKDPEGIENTVVLM